MRDRRRRRRFTKANHRNWMPNNSSSLGACFNNPLIRGAGWKRNLRRSKIPVVALRAYGY